MNQFELSLIQTAAIAVISLFIGLKIKNRFEFMDKYCIPSAVVGGLVVSIILSILYKVSGIFLTLDETIEDIFMIVFFTSIGFQVNLYVLRNIMRPLLVMICCIAVCIVLQNVLVLTIANLNGTNPYLAMTAGSITMMGGEGLARIYGPILK
ncbi:MAG: sodium/glutamate symporter, partial [Succinivibrio dextrinosolvens]|nr:sodium/glutamate symporter [Succinivibrio dextrinosolvens]